MHQIGSLICNYITRQIDGQNDSSVLTVCAQFHSDYAIVHNVRIQQLFHLLYTQPAKTNTKGKWFHKPLKYSSKLVCTCRLLLCPGV